MFLASRKKIKRCQPKSNVRNLQMGVVALVDENAVESDVFGWDYADDDTPTSE
jgi:hypothetical protein